MTLVNKDRVRYTGIDKFGRATFIHTSTGTRLVDVDNKMYNVSKDGEPDCPCSTSWQLLDTEFDFNMGKFIDKESKCQR